MKKLLFFSLIVSFVSLFGDTILNEYRKNGIENIEHLLDKELTQTNYWQKVIKTSDTTFGYIEKYNSLLICDKSRSTLKLYKKEKGHFKLINIYQAFTGKYKGDKQNEGDLKTPVGIYNLLKKLSKIDSFYGPLAFVTSYPNLYDRYENKKGHGIWIHGLPLDQKRDSFTKGCIAIDNNDLEAIDNSINLPTTLLLIYETKKLQKDNSSSLIKLLAWLYKWRNAWKYNDIDTYLSFYAKDFKRFDGKNYTSFARYKKRIFAKKEKKSILFNDINVIPYPNHPGTFQITFFEKYKSDNYKYNGPKQLLVRLHKNTIKIFSER